MKKTFIINVILTVIQSLYMPFSNRNKNYNLKNEKLGFEKKSQYPFKSGFDANNREVEILLKIGKLPIEKGELMMM